MAIMKLLFSATMVFLGLFSMCQAVPNPCSADSTVSSRPQNTSKRKNTRTAKEAEEPCRNAGPQAQPDVTSETVSWDPMTDMNRNTTGEIVGWFVLGLLISAPVFLVVRRLKSRKNESLPAKKILK
jgi:hypothetical protein